MKDQVVFAKVMADSVCNGHRLTTMHVRAPRIILSEFNTHRMFSRNSASSRAVPTSKFRMRVDKDPYFPEQWNVAGKGMTAAGPMEPAKAAMMQARAEELKNYLLQWHFDAEIACGTAKEQLNRYLEPYLYTDILVSSTEWKNFFMLRPHPAADPAMQLPADAMLEAYVESTPILLRPGQWHRPFYHPDDDGLSTEEHLKVCTARCARVSYFNFGEDNKSPDHDKDLATHDKLAESLHLSPFEHCAQAMAKQDSGKGRTPRYFLPPTGPATDRTYYHKGRSGNFVGWMQYRERFNDIIEQKLAALDLKELLTERRRLRALREGGAV